MSPSQRLSQLPVFWQVAKRRHSTFPPFPPSHPLTRHHTQSPQSCDHWCHGDVRLLTSSPARCSGAGETASRGRFCELLAQSDKKQNHAWIKSMEYKGTLLHTHSFFCLPFCLLGQPCERDWSFWGLILQLSNVKSFFNWYLWIFLEAITGGHHFQFSESPLPVGSTKKIFLSHIVLVII